MTMMSRLSSVLAATCLALVATTGANAQATRTWVSGVGDDVNPCSRTAPCKTFAGAISKTAAFGIINCLDQGGFGGVTITKSIAIICDPYSTGHVVVSGTNGITVNVASTDRVLLSGLEIMGTAVSPGLDGIKFIQSGKLIVMNSVIRQFTSASAGNGINFAPTGNATLNVQNVMIADNGVGATGSGIQIKPTGTASANVIIQNSQIHNSGVGIRADTTATTGSIAGTIRGTSSFGNASHGVLANSNGPPITLMIDSSSFDGNVGAGVRSAGTGATIRITNNTITNNANGIQTVAPGVVLSYGNNHVDGNPTENPGTATPK